MLKVQRLSGQSWRQWQVCLKILYNEEVWMLMRSTLHSVVQQDDEYSGVTTKKCVDICVLAKALYQQRWQALVPCTIACTHAQSFCSHQGGAVWQCNGNSAQDGSSNNSTIASRTESTVARSNSADTWRSAPGIVLQAKPLQHALWPTQSYLKYFNVMAFTPFDELQINCHDSNAHLS